MRGRKRAARQNSCWNYRFFIIINGVRGPEARRHVMMRRTEAGANVEDGSNNQNMVFQFDLYLLACAADGYLFPGHLVHQSSVSFEFPRLPPLCNSYVTSDNVRISHAGHFVQTIILHQLPQWPAYAPVVLAPFGSQTEIIETHVTRGTKTALSSLAKAWDVRTRTKTQK